MRQHCRFPAATYDVVAIAASAGGIDAVGHVLSALPADFPAPIVLVHHIGPRQPFLPQVLARRTRLTVRWARHLESLQAACVHIAPPEHHLIVRSPGRCLLDASAPVHRVRPCADVTFASAARTFRERTLGIVLTGYGVDAAEGALAIRCSGGVVLVQDPRTCHAPAMPEAAIAVGAHHLVLPLTAIAPAVASLVGVRGTAQLFGFRRTAEEPFPRLPVRRIGVA